MSLNQSRYERYIIVQSAFFLSIPALLWVFSGVQLDSISAYVYKEPVLFSVLLTSVARMFMTEGVASKSNYFDMFIGLSLIGVVLTPHLDYPILHYFFALVFFEGSVFNMVFYSSSYYRKFNIIFGLSVNFAIAGSFLFNWYSIFWAEWIGMLPIAVHKILETKNIIK